MNSTEAVDEAYDNLVFDVNQHWMIYAGSIVFLMQAGFSLLEAGSVAAKNSTNILFKNLLVHNLLIHGTFPRLYVNKNMCIFRTHVSPLSAFLPGAMPSPMENLLTPHQQQHEVPLLAQQTFFSLKRMGQTIEVFSSSGRLLPPLQPL